MPLQLRRPRARPRNIIAPFETITRFPSTTSAPHERPSFTPRSTNTAKHSLLRPPLHNRFPLHKEHKDCEAHASEPIEAPTSTTRTQPSLLLCEAKLPSGWASSSAQTGADRRSARRCTANNDMGADYRRGGASILRGRGMWYACFNRVCLIQCSLLIA